MLRALGRAERTALLLALLLLTTWGWTVQGAGTGDAWQPWTERSSPEEQLVTLRGEFDLADAQELLLRVDQVQRSQPERGFELGLRLGVLLARSGRLGLARTCFGGVIQRAQGTSWAGRAGLALGHALRRAQGADAARNAYRRAMHDPVARPEDRDEARAWWIRGLCATQRHAMAREEWSAFENQGASKRWRDYAQLWSLRCEREHRDARE